MLCIGFTPLKTVVISIKISLPFCCVHQINLISPQTPDDILLCDTPCCCIAFLSRIYFYKHTHVNKILKNFPIPKSCQDLTLQSAYAYSCVSCVTFFNISVSTKSDLFLGDTFLINVCYHFMSHYRVENIACYLKWLFDGSMLSIFRLYAVSISTFQCLSFPSCLCSVLYQWIKWFILLQLWMLTSFCFAVSIGHSPNLRST